LIIVICWAGWSDFYHLSFSFYFLSFAAIALRGEVLAGSSDLSSFLIFFQRLVGVLFFGVVFSFLFSRVYISLSLVYVTL
jgi:hypothetical protein